MKVSCSYFLFLALLVILCQDGVAGKYIDIIEPMLFSTRDVIEKLDLRNASLDKVLSIYPVLFNFIPQEKLSQLPGSTAASLLVTYNEDQSLAIKLLFGLPSVEQRRQFLKSLSGKELSKEVEKELSKAVVSWQYDEDWNIMYLLSIGHPPILIYIPPQFLFRLTPEYALKYLFFFKTLGDFDDISEKWMDQSTVVKRTWSKLSIQQSYPVPLDVWNIHWFNKIWYWPFTLSFRINCLMQTVEVEEWQKGIHWSWYWWDDPVKKYAVKCSCFKFLALDALCTYPPKLNFILQGMNLEELEHLDLTLDENKKQVLLLHWNAVQFRALFDLINDGDDMNAINSKLLYRHLNKFLPRHFQQFSPEIISTIRDEVFHQNENHFSISLSSGLQLFEFMLSSSGKWSLKNVNSSDSILLGKLLYTQPPTVLNQLCENPMSIKTLVNLDSVKYTPMQAYSIMICSKQIEKFPLKDTLGLQGLLSALPASYFMKLETNTISSHILSHLLTNLPSGNIPRSLALLQHFRDQFAEKLYLLELLENKENEMLSLISPIEVSLKSHSMFKSLSSAQAEGLTSRISTLPRYILSELLQKENGLNYNNLYQPNSRHLVVNGLTCDIVSTIPTTDFISILSAYNQNRIKNGHEFPKDLQRCVQEAVFLYLRLKSEVHENISYYTPSNIFHYLDQSDIAIIGGYILATIPVKDIFENYYREAIIREIGSLSLTELMLAMSASHFEILVSDYLEQSLEDGKINMNHLLLLGNLTHFISSKYIPKIKPDAFRFILESNIIDTRICATSSVRKEWENLLISAFGNPGSWRSDTLLMIGDMLISLSADVLKSINASALLYAADLFESHYTDLILSQELPFYKVCMLTMDSEESTKYLSSISGLMIYYLIAIQNVLQTIVFTPDILTKSKWSHVFNTNPSPPVVVPEYANPEDTDNIRRFLTLLTEKMGPTTIKNEEVDSKTSEQPDYSETSTQQTSSSKTTPKIATTIVTEPKTTEKITTNFVIEPSTTYNNLFKTITENANVIHSTIGISYYNSLSNFSSEKAESLHTEYTLLPESDSKNSSDNASVRNVTEVSLSSVTENVRFGLLEEVNNSMSTEEHNTEKTEMPQIYGESTTEITITKNMLESYSAKEENHSSIQNEEKLVTVSNQFISTHALEINHVTDMELTLQIINSSSKYPNTSSKEIMNNSTKLYLTTVSLFNTPQMSTSGDKNSTDRIELYTSPLNDQELYSVKRHNEEPTTPLSDKNETIITLHTGKYNTPLETTTLRLQNELSDKDFHSWELSSSVGNKKVTSQVLEITPKYQNINTKEIPNQSMETYYSTELSISKKWEEPTTTSYKSIPFSKNYTIILPALLEIQNKSKDEFHNSDSTVDVSEGQNGSILMSNVGLNMEEVGSDLTLTNITFPKTHLNNSNDFNKSIPSTEPKSIFPNDSGSITENNIPEVNSNSSIYDKTERNKMPYKRSPNSDYFGFCNMINNNARVDQSIIVKQALNPKYELTDQQLLCLLKLLNITTEDGKPASTPVHKRKPCLTKKSRNSIRNKRYIINVYDSEIKISCNALKSLGLASSLALPLIDLSAMEPDEIVNCLDLFASMNLTSDQKLIIWDRIKDKKLHHMMGKVISVVTVEELSRFNFSIHSDWALEILYLFSEYNEQPSVHREIMNKFLSENQDYAMQTSLPTEAVVSLGSILCYSKQNLLHNIFSKRERVLHVWPVFHRLKGCPSSCLSTLANIVTEALGPPQKWTSSMFYMLGSVVTGVNEASWRALIKSNSNFTRYLSSSTIRCLSPTKLQALTDDHLSKLSPIAASSISLEQQLNLSYSQIKILLDLINMNVEADDTMLPVRNLSKSSAESIVTPLFICLFVTILGYLV